MSERADGMPWDEFDRLMDIYRELEGEDRQRALDAIREKVLALNSGKDQA